MTQPATTTQPNGTAPAPDPAKARAELAKAEAEAAEARAKAAKAEADARAAETAALKAEREAAEHDSPAQRAKRDAEAAKATAAARREQLTALVPDLTKVEHTPLELTGDQPLYGAALAQHALRQAAADVAAAVGPALRGTAPWRVLVTTETDLAAADSTYLDVTTGLDQLIVAADQLLNGLPSASGGEPGHGTPDRVETDLSTIKLGESVATAGLAAAADVGAALAAALPGVLSLFSARRTITTAAGTTSDLATTAAVAGALLATGTGNSTGTVVHDDFRLVEPGRVHRRSIDLAGRRQRLAGHKLTLTDRSGSAKAGLERLRAELTALEKELKAATDPQPVNVRIDAVHRSIAAVEQDLSRDTVRLGLVDGVITAIDTFTAAISTVPAGSGRSPLATATLHERLHPAEGVESPFTHVLLVKAESATTQQLINDKPLWLDDRFSAIALTVVSYLLIEVPGSTVLAGGTATGSAGAHGEVGNRFELD